MDWRPPSSETIMNGTPHQVLTMIAANRCQKVSSSHAATAGAARPARVDDAAVGEHEPPAEDGDEGRHGPGQHQDQPVEGAAAQLLVEQQGEAEADAVVQGDTGAVQTIVQMKCDQKRS